MPEMFKKSCLGTTCRTGVLIRLRRRDAGNTHRVKPLLKGGLFKKMGSRQHERGPSFSSVIPDLIGDPVSLGSLCSFLFPSFVRRG